MKLHVFLIGTRWNCTLQNHRWNFPWCSQWFSDKNKILKNVVSPSSFEKWVQFHLVPFRNQNALSPSLPLYGSQNRNFRSKIRTFDQFLMHNIFVRTEWIMQFLTWMIFDEKMNLKTSQIVWRGFMTIYPKMTLFNHRITIWFSFVWPFWQNCRHDFYTFYSRLPLPRLQWVSNLIPKKPKLSNFEKNFRPSF